MAVILPVPIATYFAADEDNTAGVAACLTAAGVVKDEGHTYAGRDAIARWKSEASGKYNYVSEPFACDKDGDRIIVTSRLTGTFPGSPIDLRYAFTLDGHKIAQLQIGA